MRGGGGSLRLALESGRVGPRRCVVQTITVVASRSSGFGLTEMEMLIGSAIVIALVAWTVLSRVRHFRGKPHA